jgi:hypothetical protein
VRQYSPALRANLRLIRARALYRHALDCYVPGNDLSERRISKAMHVLDIAEARYAQLGRTSMRL